MFVKILLLFTLIPILELALLIKIGGVIGFWPTIGIIITTGLTGAALAKWQGLRIVNQIRTELNNGQIPGDSLLNGLFVLIAGAFLLTPGVVTDVGGLLLLLPPTWRPLRRYLKTRFVRFMERDSNRVNIRWSKGSSPIENDDDVIDV